MHSKIRLCSAPIFRRGLRDVWFARYAGSSAFVRPHENTENAVFNDLCVGERL
uniref:Uncharacterized protein n=1 Tax=Anguilla anguilla TaxID=7936 RepID=A0A0E9XS11_ANGAN